MDAATSDLASSEALPPMRTRSPTCRSDIWIGVAFFRLFSPGAILTIRVAADTVTFTSEPESGVSVRVLPSMALIAPIRLAMALGAASCACGFIGEAKASANRKLARQRAIDTNVLVECMFPSLIYMGRARERPRFTKFYPHEYKALQRWDKEEKCGNSEWSRVRVLIPRSAGSRRRAIPRQSTARGKRSRTPAQAGRLRQRNICGCFRSRWFRLRETQPAVRRPES